MSQDISLDYKLVDLIVTGVYTEKEETIGYDNDMNGYPGSPSGFEVEKITVKDSNINIYELLRYEDLKDIERMCINIIEG